MHSSTNSLAFLKSPDELQNPRFDRNMNTSTISPMKISANPSNRMEIKTSQNAIDGISTSDGNNSNSLLPTTTNPNQLLLFKAPEKSSTNINIMNTSAISVGKNNMNNGTNPNNTSLVRPTSKRNTTNKDKLNIFENQYVTQEEINDRLRKQQRDQQSKPPTRILEQPKAPRGPLAVTFAEDDYYCYFVKGSIISEKGKSNEQPSGQKTSSNNALQLAPLKSALKDLKNRRPKSSTSRASNVKSRDKILLVSDQVGNNPNSAPKIREIRILSDTTLPFPSTQPTKQTDNSNLLQTINDDEDLAGGGGGSSPRDIEEISRLLASQSTIRSRQQRNNFNLPANGESTSKFGQAQKRTSISHFRPEILEKYEKSDYMKRSSDTKRLLQFQKRHENSLLHRLISLLTSLAKFFQNVLSLNLIMPPKHAISSSPYNATTSFFTHFINSNLIACLIFIYPIILMFTQSSSIGQFLLNNRTTCTGHCFIALCVLSGIKLTKCISDFSLSRIEKLSFKTLFSDLNWRTTEQNYEQNNQQNVLAEKWKRIDSILENIDDQDDDQLQLQIILMTIAQLTLSAVNVILLYFILDDSLVLQTVTDSIGSSKPFLSRLVIAILTSLLIQFNNLAIRLFFHAIQTPVAFSFYEKAQIIALFFNHVSIIMLYEIKILSYVDTYFAYPVLSITPLTDLQHLAYPNIALAVSESVLYLIELLIIFLHSKWLTITSQRKQQKQVVPYSGSDQPLIVEHVEIDNNNNNINTNNNNINNIISPEIKNSSSNNIQQRRWNTASFNLLPSNNAITPRRANNMNMKTELIMDDKPSSVESDRLVKSAIRYGSSYAYLRKSIFICCFNFIVLNCAVLSPIMFIFGLVLTTIFTLIHSIASKRISSMVVISFLDFKQLNSMQNRFGLILIALSVLINFSIGFSNAYVYFSEEFSYFETNSSLNSIIGIVLMPSLLFPLAALFAIFLIQSVKKHQNAYDALNETYSEIRSKAFQQKMQTSSMTVL